MVQAFSKNPSTTGSDSSGSSVRPKYTRHDSQARDSRPLGAGAGRPPPAAAVAIDARRGRRNGTVEIVSLVQNCQATETTKPSNEAASYYSHEQMPPDTCAGQVVADSLDSGCMGPAYQTQTGPAGSSSDGAWPAWSSSTTASNLELGFSMLVSYFRSSRRKRWTAYYSNF